MGSYKVIYSTGVYRYRSQFTHSEENFRHAAVFENHGCHPFSQLSIRTAMGQHVCMCTRNQDTACSAQTAQHILGTSYTIYSYKSGPHDNTTVVLYILLCIPRPHHIYVKGSYTTGASDRAGSFRKFLEYVTV